MTKCLQVCGWYLIRFFLVWQVKQESLGISTKMVLKVDVESGKLYFKKSKDGPEDKYFVHNKSKNLFLLCSIFGEGSSILLDQSTKKYLINSQESDTLESFRL